MVSREAWRTSSLLEWINDEVRGDQPAFQGGVGVAMSESGDFCIARLTPTAASNIDALLALPLGMDVWERRGEVLVVRASEAQLSELERRRLAHVERLSTQAEFEARAARRATRDNGGRRSE